MSPLNRLLLTLRFYATGSFIISAGDFIGISKTSSFNIIEEVTEAIVRLRQQFISMPTSAEDMARISANFFEMARFPQVIGVIDGTHIRMQSPGKSNIYFVIPLSSCASLRYIELKGEEEKRLI